MFFYNKNIFMIKPNMLITKSSIEFKILTFNYEYIRWLISFVAQVSAQFLSGIVRNFKRCKILTKSVTYDTYQMYHMDRARISMQPLRSTIYINALHTQSHVLPIKKEREIPEKLLSIWIG